MGKSRTLALTTESDSIRGTGGDVDEGRKSKEIWIGRQDGNLIIGDGGTINSAGRDITHVSGSQLILRPDLVPEVMEKLDEVVRVLEASREEIPDRQSLLKSAKAAAEEVRAHHPRRKRILDFLTDISSGITTSASLVAAVGPLVDAVVKLVR